MFPALVSTDVVTHTNVRRLKATYSFPALFEQIEKQEVAIGLFFCYFTNKTIASIIRNEDEYNTWQDILDTGSHRLEGFYVTQADTLQLLQSA